jgi:excisionase family DNA binding protein
MSADKVTFSEAETSGDKQKFFDKLIWLTVKQAAIYLSRTENAIRILIHKGTLQRHRLGGKIYLKKSEIDHALEKSIFGGVYGS